MEGIGRFWKSILCYSFLLILFYYQRMFLSHILTANKPLLNPLISPVQVPIYNKGIDNVVKIQNLTSPSSTILIYNKVQKCGSSTLSEIIRSLGRLNHFDVTDFGRFPFVSKEVRESRIQKMLKRSFVSHHAAHGHVFFFDDIRDYNGTIVWMNWVRDPVDRFISRYNVRKTKSDLNKCVAANGSLCSWTSVQPQLAYFCGQDPACSERNSRWALQRAIYHVENYYSVVGVFEDRSLSYEVLEAYIPMFFTGMKTIEAEKVMKQVGSLEKRELVTNATKALLRNILKEEYEFYEFLRQRLYAQAKSIGLL